MTFLFVKIYLQQMFLNININYIYLYMYISYFNLHLEKKCDDNLGKIIQFILESETLVTTDTIMTPLTYQEG